MDTKLLFQDAPSLVTPLLAVFAVDLSTGKDATALPALLTTNNALSKAAATVLSSGEFKAGSCETLLLHAPSGIKAERLLIVGLGKVSKLTVHEVRKGAGAAVRFAKPRGLRELAMTLPEAASLSDDPIESLPTQLTARAIVEGAYVGDFDPDTYRSDRKDLSIQMLTVVSNAKEGSSEGKEFQTGVSEGIIFGTSQNFARTLVNEPGNVLTPTVLGARAKAELEPLGIKTEVYSTEKLQELKMGSFWGVAKGSAEPPALVVMTYEPEKATSSEVIGLVGKGITFDTGGISIKPSEGMEKMKYDMAGAAAMIGAMRAIAQLKPTVKVISVVCSAENMPSGTAYKPGDVLTAMSGKTIEIINTDAEGRLVLADGLAYARKLGVTRLIDAATLTGACVVALGMLNAGLFSNDEATWQRFMDGTKLSGENFWRLPCTDEYRDLIKSNIADIMNTGGSRWGGAITAAMFLKEFVEDTPWIHLDIAGCAWMEEQKPWIAKGPSGIAVRSIVEWVRSYA
ncbi:MAG: leucyl aminopeptidase [Acidobacteriaceae bacterium]